MDLVDGGIKVRCEFVETCASILNMALRLLVGL